MFLEINEEVRKICKDNSYKYPKVIGENGVCVIAPFITTSAIMIKLSEEGYEQRYCYPHEFAEEMLVAFAQWDGIGHPKGRWIKCKGYGVQFSNPDYPNDETHPNWIDVKSMDSVTSLLGYIRLQTDEELVNEINT